MALGVQPPKPSFLHTLYAVIFVHREICNFYRDIVMIVNALRTLNSLKPIKAPENEFANTLANDKILAFETTMRKKTEKYASMEKWRKGNEKRLKRQINKHANEFERRMLNEAQHQKLDFVISDPINHHVQVRIGQHSHDSNFTTVNDASDFQYAVNQGE